ncbi:MAG: DUF2125 domain-containing protein [Magnetovibrio sp.]|nr:DUF2125 domain-containing protein [Magnetovibrio sp.]
MMRIFHKKQRRPQGAQDLGNFSHPALNYQKPKQLKRFQAFIVMLASAALVFGLWSFVWYAMSAVVKAEVKGWVEKQRTMGAIVDFSDMSTSGFPTRIILTLKNPRFEGPAFGDTISWQSVVLQVMARPWRPWTLHVKAPGQHKLELGDGRMSFAGAAQVLSADVVLGDIRPERLELKVRGLTFNGSAPLAVDRLNVSFSHDPGAQASATGIRLKVQGSGITVPGGLPQPLGDQVQSIDLVARITGSVVPGPARQRVPAWRDSGGAVDVERLKFRSGPLALAAAGTAALDQNLQPQGAFTAKIEGLFQVMEILRAKGVMRASEAVVATMALSALSKRPKGGGVPFINISITVQDGTLSIGPLKVMKMPQMNWGFSAVSAPPKNEPAAQPQPRDYKAIKPVY